MKKLFVFALATSLLASCSNAGDSAAKEIKDSADSVKNEKIESVKDAANAAIDTIKKNTDSFKNKVDTIASKTVDSLKK